MSKRLLCALPCGIYVGLDGLGSVPGIVSHTCASQLHELPIVDGPAPTGLTIRQHSNKASSNLGKLSPHSESEIWARF